MNGFLDVYSLIFLLVAIAIFWKLRSVLGRKTGHERPPADPFARREEKTPTPVPSEPGDNVVALPRAARPAPVGAEPANAGVDSIAPAGSALNTALRMIVSADRGFDARHFLDGARVAYEMIVTSFATGDRESLRNLLGPDVFERFDEAITERERRGEAVETTFVGIDKAEITEAALRGSSAQITIRFVSQLISVTRDRNGGVIDGDPVKVTEVTDVWTFARDTRSRDPNWKLVATEAEG